MNDETEAAYCAGSAMRLAMLLSRIAGEAATQRDVCDISVDKAASKLAEATRELASSLSELAELRCALLLWADELKLSDCADLYSRDILSRIQGEVA